MEEGVGRDRERMIEVGRMIKNSRKHINSPNCPEAKQILPSST